MILEFVYVACSPSHSISGYIGATQPQSTLAPGRYEIDKSQSTAKACNPFYYGPCRNISLDFDTVEKFMKNFMIDSKALRMTFLVTGLVIWLGIWLTGFGAAHWLLYVPAAFLTFAGATGICPGLIINKKLLREN